MPVEGTALPLWGLEIDPDRAKEDFRAFNARDDGKVTDVPAILTAACALKLLSYHFSELRLAFTRRFVNSRKREFMFFHVRLKHRMCPRGELSLLCAELEGLYVWNGAGHDSRPAGRSEAGGAAGHTTARVG